MTQKAFKAKAAKACHESGFSRTSIKQAPSELAKNTHNHSSKKKKQ